MTSHLVDVLEAILSMVATMDGRVVARPEWKLPK